MTSPSGRSWVLFIPLPIQIACPVKVTPDGETLRGGKPIPIDERTEYCAVPAHWMIGSQISCDCHTLMACEMLGIDFDSIVKEAGRTPEEARAPWCERRRETQAEAADVERLLEALSKSQPSKED